MKRFLTYSHLFLGVLFLITSFSLSAQEKNKLQAEKAQLKKEISLVNKLISENKKATNSAQSQVQNLQNKIAIRKKLIRNIRMEYQLLERDIVKQQSEIEQLSEELEHLKEEYAKMCVQHFKSRSTHTRIMYILSSESFYQAFKRFRYIKSYSDLGKEQGAAITAKQEEKLAGIALLESQKEKKQQLITAKSQENKKLVIEQKQEQALLSELSSKNKDLLKQLRQKEAASQKLQREIERIIAMEIEAERKKAEANAKKENKTVKKGSSKYVMTPEATALSKSFASNKNKLPWPVEKGILQSKFGKQPYPGVAGVYTNNPGVEIATEKGAYARAVFDGMVTRIQVIPGGNMVVYVRHGEYFTIYSNLSKVYVKQGDKIKIKQKLGEIFTNSNEGKTVLEFMLYQGKSKQNPASWIYNM